MALPFFALLGKSPQNTLPVAALLVLAAGMLDAYTYVGYGGVFANAVTGDTVMLMAHVARGDLSGAERYVTPLIAYVCGVAVAHTLKERPLRSLIPAPARVSLGVEILFLVVVAFLPHGVPDMAIVAGIAFVAAMQATAFTRVGPFAFTSVTTSANLRRFAESFMAATVFRQGSEASLQLLYFLVVCLCFFAGALAGGWATYRVGHAAVWLPVVLLSLALLLCLPWNSTVHEAFEKD